MADYIKQIEHLEKCSTYGFKQDECREAAASIKKLLAERDKAVSLAKSVTTKYETAVKIQVQMTEASNRLSADNARLQAELEAAKADISRVSYKHRCMPCIVCKHEEVPMLVSDHLNKTSPCLGCNESNSHFEWRGEQK